MGVLDKAKNERERVAIRAGDIPSYNKRGFKKSILKNIALFFGALFILVSLCIGAIYVPVIFHKEEVKVKDNPRIFTPDETGIKSSLDYIKDHPTDDFDMDGLSNKDEDQYSTDAKNPDSDMDGVSDYAEIRYNTRPNEADDNIVSIVKGKLDENNISYSAPYKIHDVVLWADDIKSRAKGTVVPTLRGYRFSKFDGWAQFPSECYAYLVKDGIHTPLTYRENENAWKIEAAAEDAEIEIYLSPLPTRKMLTFFGKKYYVKDNTVAEVLSAILPKEHSFVCCQTIVQNDNEFEEITATITGTEMPKFNPADMTRFEKHMNSLEDYTRVLSSIKAGKPVIVSLQSSSFGELLCLAYGYTNEYGDLMIAGKNGITEDSNGNPIILDIIEKSAITIDQNGELRQREYFDFVGLGFDSTKGDKIYFIFEN